MKLKIDKSQCIALLLTGSLLVNAGIHFSHPSYKYYKQNISRIDTEFKDFRKRVQDEFVPAVMFVATNINAMAALSSPPLSTNSEAVASLSHEHSQPLQPVDVDCSYFVFEGKRGFYYRGFPFFAGDTFHGEEILFVDPSSFKTSERLYYIRPVRDKEPTSRKVAQL